MHPSKYVQDLCLKPFNNTEFQYRHEQEKTQLNTENVELRKRMSKLEKESEEMSENRLHLVGKMTVKNNTTVKAGKLKFKTMCKHLFQMKSINSKGSF